MAQQTYTVKSGDNLSTIAKNYGVSTKDISGYSSGNPDLIKPGEVLTVGASPTKSTATDYSTAVKDGLTGDSSSTSSTKTSGSTDDYLSTLRDSIAAATKTVNDSATALAGLKTKAYDDEYATSGLSDIKTKISSLDSDIAAKKAARDAAVAKVQQNPGLSAAAMTGTAKKLADQANAEINDSIEERNSLAGDYNTGLTELTNKVSAKVGDAQTQYDTATKALTALTGQASDYQTALNDTLKQSDTKDYQDKELEIALMNANTAASKAASGGTDAAWKLAISPLTGKPIYWYNSNGDTKPLSAADVAAASGQAPAPAASAASDTSVENPAPAAGNWFSNILSALNPFK